MPEKIRGAKKKLTDWRGLLKADPTDWLLEKDNPSVRYFTLRDILDKGENDTDVKDACRAIMTSYIVNRILVKQNADGSWGVPENFYDSKYKGTVWNIILLAELGADGKDERIRKTAEFILKNSQDRSSGGFSTRGTPENGGDHSAVIPCLTGNMVFSLLRFGYLEDKRVQEGIEWLTKYQRFDDGIKIAPKGWPYDKHQTCYGKHTCHMGAIKTLKALAEIPIDKRTKAVEDTITKGAEYFLKHHLYKKSHDLSLPAKPFWVRFGFPLLWNTDAMEILSILVNLGYQDNRMQDTIELMQAKQNEQGQWVMEKSYNNRFLVSIEKDGKPSKWLTLNALKILKGLGRSS